MKDKHLCSVLAKNVVNDAMAGFNNFKSWKVRIVSAYLPNELVAKLKEAVISKGDRNWMKVDSKPGQTTLLDSEVAQPNMI